MTQIFAGRESGGGTAVECSRKRWRSVFVLNLNLNLNLNPFPGRVVLPRRVMIKIKIMMKNKIKRGAAR